MNIQNPVVRQTLANTFAAAAACGAAWLAQTYVLPAPVEQQQPAATKFDHYHDVLIIGGGIVGTSLAYHLRGGNKSGTARVDTRAMSADFKPLSVAVLEKGTVGAEATGLSAGTVCGFGRGNGSDLFAEQCAETIDTFLEVEAAGYDCGWVQSGALELATTAEQAAYLQAEHSGLAANGYVSQYLKGVRQVAKAEPALRGTAAVAALHTPLSGHVDPLLAACALAEAAAARGAAIHDRTQVVSISRALAPSPAEAGPAGAEPQAPVPRYIVQTADGTNFAARHVVVAAGVWCNDLLMSSLAIAVPVIPVKGMIWSTDALPAGTLKKVIFGAESHVHWAKVSTRDDARHIPERVTHDRSGVCGTRHLYGRQRLDGTVIFGGSRIPASLGDEAVDLPNTDVTRNYDHVAEVFPQVRKYGEIAGAWAGLMPFPKDGQPLVGSLGACGYEGLWLAGGFASRGIMQGPGCMRFLAHHIAATERAPSMPAGQQISSSQDNEYRAAIWKRIDKVTNPCRDGGAYSTIPAVIKVL